ncbi:MAG: YciI family protein [Hyphomicrobiaceae bacterium]
MFVVLLKFSSNKSEASQFMQGHKAWLQSGLQDGVFILAGSLQPDAGGAILAHNVSLSELQERVDRDPFVRHDVVSAEILEITPSRTDPRLSFLLE